MEPQQRIDRAIEDIDIRIKYWESIRSDLDIVIDDNWDFEHEIQEAAMEAALYQLTSIRDILVG